MIIFIGYTFGFTISLIMIMIAFMVVEVTVSTLKDIFKLITNSYQGE